MYDLLIIIVLETHFKVSLKQFLYYEWFLSELLNNHLIC